MALPQSCKHSDYRAASHHSILMFGRVTDPLSHCHVNMACDMDRSPGIIKLFQQILDVSYVVCKNFNVVAADVVIVLSACKVCDCSVSSAVRL